MDTTTLRLFVEVARRGSFASAARHADLDASSVSRAVAGLEDRLGVRLFQRSTRRLAPTDAGERFLARIEPLLDELESAAAEAADQRTAIEGTLRLTASVTFGQVVLAPLLPALRRRHPGLALECVFTDSQLDLVAERIDLAVRLAASVEGDLVAARLMSTRYHVVVSPAYRAAAAPLQTPADLATHRCLRFTLREFRTRWLFRDADGSVTSVPIDGDVTLSPAGMLREAALAGLGPALLPDWLIGPDLGAGRLIDPFPAHTATATTFDTGAWLVYPSRSFLPAKVAAVIAFLREHLGRNHRLEQRTPVLAPRSAESLSPGRRSP